MKILIALPVYNEETILESNTLRLYDFMKKNFTDEWQIVVADNNSSDRTGEIGKNLEKNFERIKYLYVQQKGKGRAIRAVWENGDADVYIFMDADLATDLSALPALISAVSEEKYDIATGSRFHKNSKVKRSLFRKFVSRVYRLVLRLLLKTNIKDAPCGFKAVNRDIIKNVLPLVQNDEWFFDTEMMILAERKNYRIKEISVIWTEHAQSGRKSRVNFLNVSLNYLKEVWRLKKIIRKNDVAR